MSKTQILKEFYKTEYFEKMNDTLYYIENDNKYIRIVDFQELIELSKSIVLEEIEDILKRYKVPSHLKSYFNTEKYLNDKIKDPFDIVFYYGSFEEMEDEDGNTYYFAET